MEGGGGGREIRRKWKGERERRGKNVGREESKRFLLTKRENKRGGEGGTL